MTSADISDSVTWTTVDTATATVSSTGLLSGVEVGSTKVMATKDRLSNWMTVNVCSSLAGPCLDIFDAGGGKLFTNSPSVAYLDRIGGSATNGTTTEKGVYGPAGDFYIFNWSNANALCETYNTNRIGGRTNWRLATKDELKTELFDVYGNMFRARGWPTNYGSWSVTPDDSLYYYVRLGYDICSPYPYYLVGSGYPSCTSYASCVSNL
ncbi:TPA: DUF1566 domain-containing protein [Vibrio cholerae]|nr:DUF1566 domain-containing protein [Vibrio cholerae]